MNNLYVSVYSLLLISISACSNKVSQNFNEPIAIRLSQPDSLYFGGTDHENCERLYAFQLVNSTPP